MPTAGAAATAEATPSPGKAPAAGKGKGGQQTRSIQAGGRPGAGCSRDQKRKIRLVYTEIYQVEQSIDQDIPRETKKYTEIYPVIPSYRMLYRLGVIPSYTVVPIRVIPSITQYILWPILYTELNLV